MAVQIRTETLGRNILEIRDTTGVSTAGATEYNLLVNGDSYAGVANGYIDMGEFTGCTLYIEYTETGGAGGGTLKSYGAITQATTMQYAATTDQTITASTTAKYTISNCPRYLRLTITRTAADITVKYKMTAYKPAGTL